ncbi:rhomboid family intramembrane serine protease [bacterium]|nr:rhomboid family intramembrane serine protease [bacterium]
MFPLRDNKRPSNFPAATWTLIIINILVFFWETTLDKRSIEDAIKLYALVPRELLTAEAISWQSRFLPLLTSLFLHGSLLHLALNLWTLHLFGDNVEDRMGVGRFIFFYILCGLGSGIVHAVVFKNSSMPVIGASGAVSGVIAAYAFMYPGAKIITVIPIIIIPYFIQIRAFFYIAVWFIAQILAGSQLGAAAGQENVAWWGHIGGFLTGFFIFWIFIHPERSD